MCPVNVRSARDSSAVTGRTRHAVRDDRVCVSGSGPLAMSKSTPFSVPTDAQLVDSGTTVGAIDQSSGSNMVASGGGSVSTPPSRYPLFVLRSSS